MNPQFLNMVLGLLTNSNPQQIIQNNPQFQAVLNQAQQSGSVRDYVLQYAKQNGVDLNPVLTTLRQRGFNF